MKSSLLTRFCEDFNLNGTNCRCFLRSEWESWEFDGQEEENEEDANRIIKPYKLKVSWTYITYRFLYMCFFLVVTIQNMLCDLQDLNVYFIYLTNCSFTIQLLYSTLYFFTLLWVKLFPTTDKQSSDIESNDEIQYLLGNDNSSKLENELPFVYKLLWILVNIVNAVPYGVTAIYWPFLYQGAGTKTCENVLTFFLHAANSLVALLDNLIIAIPIHLTHMIFPLLTTTAYVLFTYLYELLNGIYEEGEEYIYSILDWNNKPTSAIITSIVGVSSILIIHPVFCYAISKLRIYIVKKYFTT